MRDEPMELADNVVLIHLGNGKTMYIDENTGEEVHPVYRTVAESFKTVELLKKVKVDWEKDDTGWNWNSVEDIRLRFKDPETILKMMGIYNEPS